jgi:hypothetical protein
MNAPWLKYKPPVAEPPHAQVVEEPSKGLCIDCGHPVHWRGPAQGLVNAFGQPIHLRCPERRLVSKTEIRPREKIGFPLTGVPSEGEKERRMPSK